MPKPKRLTVAAVLKGYGVELPPGAVPKRLNQQSYYHSGERPVTIRLPRALARPPAW